MFIHILLCKFTHLTTLFFTDQHSLNTEWSHLYINFQIWLHMFYKTFLRIFSDFCSGCSGNVRSFRIKTIKKTKKMNQPMKKRAIFSDLSSTIFCFINIAKQFVVKPTHLQTEIHNDCIDQHNQCQLSDVSKIYASIRSVISRVSKLHWLYYCLFCLLYDSFVKKKLLMVKKKQKYFWN